MHALHLNFSTSLAGFPHIETLLMMPNYFPNLSADMSDPRRRGGLAGWLLLLPLRLSRGRRNSLCHRRRRCCGWLGWGRSSSPWSHRSLLSTCRTKTPLQSHILLCKYASCEKTDVVGRPNSGSKWCLFARLLAFLGLAVCALTFALYTYMCVCQCMYRSYANS